MSDTWAVRTFNTNLPTFSFSLLPTDKLQCKPSSIRLLLPIFTLTVASVSFYLQVCLDSNSAAWPHSGPIALKLLLLMTSPDIGAYLVPNPALHLLNNATLPIAIPDICRSTAIDQNLAIFCNDRLKLLLHCDESDPPPAVFIFWLWLLWCLVFTVKTCQSDTAEILPMIWPILMKLQFTVGHPWNIFWTLLPFVLLVRRMISLKYQTLQTRSHGWQSPAIPNRWPRYPAIKCGCDFPPLKLSLMTDRLGTTCCNDCSASNAFFG